MLILTILPGSANITSDSFMIFDAHSESFVVTALFFSMVDEVCRQDTRSR